MGFRIDYVNNQVAIVRLSGRIDVMSSQILRSNFELMARHGLNTIVADLEHVQFIDSSGLSAFVTGFRLMRQNGGTFLLAQPNPQIEATLRLTNFHRFFGIYRNVLDALTAVSVGTAASNPPVTGTIYAS